MPKDFSCHCISVPGYFFFCQKMNLVSHFSIFYSKSPVPNLFSLQHMLSVPFPTHLKGILGGIHPKFWLSSARLPEPSWLRDPLASPAFRLPFLLPPSLLLSQTPLPPLSRPWAGTGQRFRVIHTVTIQGEPFPVITAIKIRIIVAFEG